MAWFGDGLSSLSNLKGQITSFTKEVLSEGIVEEMDERSKELNEANERCVQLQELLNSKDAEISLLRRQNCELQKAVVELNAKPKESNDVKQEDDGDSFFWDPSFVKNRNPKNQNNVRLLQEQLSQATMRIRELEADLKSLQKLNNSTMKEEISDGHQKAEFLRAKQDMMNRIIQLEEKNREAERSAKRMQLDEISLINDFRTVLSKLKSREKMDLVRGALKALENEDEQDGVTDKEKKSDFDEKSERLNANGHHETAIPLKSNFEESANLVKRNDEFVEASDKKEIESLQKRINELQSENKTLFDNIEMLDQQHEEFIEKLLSIKEELEKKHHCLQNAYEQLYVDYNGAQNRVAELESALAARSETKENIGGTVDRVCQTSQTENLPLEEKDVQVEADLINDEKGAIVHDLEVKIKDILKNSCIDVEGGESIFESVARHYVDAKWKKDVLERKVTEVTRDLKEAVEIKDTLQLECDDMQANIDTLLMEIQHLKLNLPSIPEASEERVASLEIETESLHEEVKRLQAANDDLQRKNTELATTVHDVKDSLRNQENVEAEVRNTKQQLDIAKQQLDGTSGKISVDESAMEDLSRKLHASLDENNELRKRIDLLERSERQLQEEVKESSAKSKELDENAKLIEELKFQLQTTKQELNSTIQDARKLENNVSILEEVKNEVERYNEELYRRNEKLEAELSKLRENDLKNEGDDLLRDLQEQLGDTIREKEDLEYDILNMRKELDSALKELESKQCQVTKLSQENESLSKEKTSLIEQLTATQDESLEKIELLNTEMSLLEQEHTEVKEHASNSEQELNDIKNKLSTMEKEYTELEEKYSSLNSTLQQVRRENEDLCRKVDRVGELESELNSKRSATEELSRMKERCSQMESEVSTLSYTLLQLRTEITSLQSERDELIALSSKTNNETEKQQLVAILEDNNQLVSEIMELQNKLTMGMDANEEAAEMARETIESLSNLVNEKDTEISDLKAASAATNAENAKYFLAIKAERDELVNVVQIKHNESVQYHAEIQRLTQLLNEQTSQMQTIISDRNANMTLLKDKDAALLWTQNELQVVQQRLKNLEESNNYGETCGIIEHSTQSKELSILKEKSDALEAALVQEQSNNRVLQNQLNESQNKEATAAKELERLRAHLVEMESNYTEEALISEETRKELEAKLLQAEEKVKNSSTVYTSASIRANQQVETLEQQMALIVQQRDDIQNKLSLSEDKVLAQTAALTNLQLVLEQFQQDKEKDIIIATRKIQNKLDESHKKQEELLSEISDLKEQLAEAKEYLQAASRLTEQLDKKAERIELLNQEVERLSGLVNTADERIAEAMRSGEGKVDKTLIKNLLLGYLSSSATDKSSVLRVFATVLDFNDMERDKAGLNNANAHNGWFSRLSSSGTVPTKDQEASLSAAFVRFLESESKPKPQLPALPISSSPLSRPGHSRQHSSSSTQSTLLLSNVNLPTFPDFIPARNTGSILKEVLKDS